MGKRRKEKGREVLSRDADVPCHVIRTTLVFPIRMERRRPSAKYVSDHIGYPRFYMF